LLAWVLGNVSEIVGRAIAILLSLVTVCVWVSILGEELQFGKVFAGSFLFLGAPIYSLSADVYLAHEFWTGTLICVSILFYARGWRYLAFTAGLLALFIRELALPFVIVMLLLSLYEKKHKEAAVWILGIIAFSIMMVIHYFNVKEVMPPDRIYSYARWVTLGGWKFVLSTASVHPYLLLLPSWIAAVLVPLMLLGLTGWKGPLGLRMGLTVGIYMFIFLFVGQTFNLYWGSLYVNLLFPGLLYLPLVTSDLCRSVNLFQTETQ